MDVERKNFILSKNSNRNNYREHCINQIPRTVVLGGGWIGRHPQRGKGKNECCGLTAKKAENDGCERSIDLRIYLGVANVQCWMQLL